MRPGIPRRAETEVIAQNLLEANDAYAPVELLLAANALSYDEYQAWRRGERRTLDGAWSAGTAETRRLVEEADAWARSLRLQAEEVSFYGVEENAGVELNASADADLDRLLHTEYRVATNRRQTDIFLDAGHTRAVNGLIAALSIRDATQAASQLQRLKTLEPRHSMLHDGSRLIEALLAPPPAEREAALQQMQCLERQWLPAASAVLRAGARDFVTPLWRRIAVALDDDTPFDATAPKRHAAWAYLNGLDWASVQRSVGEVQDCETEPALIEWLAEAKWWLRDRQAALALWFKLCWIAPGRFVEAVDAVRFPDASLRAAWRRMQDEGWASKAPIAAVWLPAWMALEEPGIAHAFKPTNGRSAPEQAFDLLLRLDAGGSDREDIENRRRLQEVHPPLFERYLAAVDS